MNKKLICNIHANPVSMFSLVFGFGKDMKPCFTGKKLHDGKVSKIEAKRFPDILAWLNFGPLFEAMCQDPKLAQTYDLGKVTRINAFAYHQLFKGVDYFFYWNVAHGRFMATDSLKTFFLALGDSLAAKVKQTLNPEIISRCQSHLAEAQIQIRQTEEYYVAKQQLAQDAEKAEKARLLAAAKKNDGESIDSIIGAQPKYSTTIQALAS